MKNEYSLVEVENPYATYNVNSGKEIVSQKQNSHLDNLYPNNKEQVFILAQKLGLPNKADTLEDKVRKVNKAIISILKKEKKLLEEPIYSFDELKTITEKHNLELDLHTVLKSKIRCPFANYCFEEVFDNEGSRKYKLTNYIDN